MDHGRRDGTHGAVPAPPGPPGPSAPSRGAWWRRVAGALVVVAVAGGTLTALSRQFLSDAHTPFVEFAAVVPLALPLLVVAAFVGAALRRRRTASLAAALAVVHLAMVAPAMGVGAPRSPGPASPASPDGPTGTREITVMTFNALTGLADPQAVIRTVRDRDVDVLALEETTFEFAVALRRRGLKDLLPYEAGRTSYGAGGTTLWSRWPAEYVGEVRGTGYALPKRAILVPGGPRITVTAVHTLSPIPGRVRGWRVDLEALAADVPRVSGPQVYLGDFNATRDHAAFRRLLSGPSALTDASEAVGLIGGAWPGFTWPSGQYGGVPSFLRLDHVLVTPSSIAVRSVDVVPLPGSDHSAVVARLAVAAGP